MEEKINYKTGNIIILILCLILPMVATVRLLDHDNWITAVRRVQWVNGDGSEIINDPDALYERNSCSPADGSIRGESHIWSYCYASQDDNKRMARIDFEAKVGTLWRFPKEFPLYSIVGMCVGPNDALAIVYWTDDFRGQLVAGVLDDNGWQIKPMALPHIKEAIFHAMAWVDGKVNIVYSEGFLDPAKELMPHIAQIGVEGIKTSVFEKPDSHNEDSGYGVPCSFFYKDDMWWGRFTMVRYNSYKGYQYLELSEKGTCHVRSEGLCGRFFSDDVVDLAVFGVQRLPTYINGAKENGKRVFLAQLNGDLTPRPTPSLPGWRRQYVIRWMAPSDAGMKRILFRDNDDDTSYIRPYKEGWLQTVSTRDQSGNYFVMKLLDTNGDMALEKVVTIDPGDLINGIPITRKDDGFWMVSASGYYLTLGPNLERLDGRSVWEHLRGRGSWNLSRRHYEYRHFIKLLWVLFGLPLSILVGWAYARLRKKDLNLAYRASAMVFLISGGLCLFQLFPLLH